jgi:AcrR family transcriptional regulator
VRVPAGQPAPIARLPKGRQANLTPEAIVDEALRQFDEGTGEPTIRSLAAGLGAGPSAIYHHFPSRAAIVQRAVERVWGEAMARRSGTETRRSLGHVIAVSVTDPGEDEELFVDPLRGLVAGLGRQTTSRACRRPER